MQSLRVIIAGSRNYTDRDEFMAHMGEIMVQYRPMLDENIVVISGGARGVDKLGEYWADFHGYEILEFIPEWDKYGRRAGFIRNAQMAENADVLIAFWDGVSKGTENMINIARKRGLKVIIRMI